jgi:hypothetical protein
MNQVLEFKEIQVLLFIHNHQNHLIINKNISKQNVDEQELI